jgi:hypothetical protein
MDSTDTPSSDHPGRSLAIRFGPWRNHDGYAFTYQGQPKDTGVPLTGTADLRSTLWNSVNGVASIRAAQTTVRYPVRNGLLAVDLNFGQRAFDGHRRWLQIQVHVPAGVGTYTTPTPRQPISPAPYTVFAARRTPPTAV